MCVQFTVHRKACLAHWNRLQTRTSVDVGTYAGLQDFTETKEIAKVARTRSLWGCKQKFLLIMLEGSRGHVKPTFCEKWEKVLPPNGVIKVERGPKKGRKRMKEWGEVTFMKEWVKALSERSILAPADLRYLFSFPRYRNLKMHSWSIQIYNSNILPLLNAWFEACFSGPNKPLLTQWE